MGVEASFPFLKLPRELRDHIFDLLWSNTLIAFRHESLVTIGRYETSLSPIVLNTLPPWLATIRQIRDEGMDQFYRRARFNLGEHATLPLHLHRCDPARPYTSSRHHRSMSTDDSEEGQSAILQVSSDLLDLRRARTLKIEKLSVRLSTSFASRADCIQRSKAFCNSNCCVVQLKVSIGTEDPHAITLDGYGAATRPPSYFRALQSLLADDRIQLRDLELDIIPRSQKRRGGSAHGYARYLWMKGNQQQAEMHYDWSFFDKLPRNLRRINIGIIEDSISTMGWPNFYVLALQQIRRKCEEVVADLVDLRETNQAQAINVAHWSYVRNGKPTWYYSRPEHERTPTGTDSEYFCSRSEAVSPLSGPQNSHIDDIDSIVERSGVGDSMISQRTTSRSTVLRRA
jgi:hypothetical protein